MAKSSKNIAKARAAVVKPAYALPDAVTLLKQVKYAKFDETIDLMMRLGVDTRHADQMVRGTVVLPHGLGKTKTVAVIATGDRQKEATAAGVDFVGGEEMVEKIQKENWTAFDALIATPDMMKGDGFYVAHARLGRKIAQPASASAAAVTAAAAQPARAWRVDGSTGRSGRLYFSGASGSKKNALRSPTESLSDRRRIEYDARRRAPCSLLDALLRAPPCNSSRLPNRIDSVGHALAHAGTKPSLLAVVAERALAGDAARTRECRRFASRRFVASRACNGGRRVEAFDEIDDAERTRRHAVPAAVADVGLDEDVAELVADDRAGADTLHDNRRRSQCLHTSLIIEPAVSSRGARPRSAVSTNATCRQVVPRSRHRVVVRVPAELVAVGRQAGSTACMRLRRPCSRCRASCR